ncbi:MAG: flagellar filament capping protein FliD [Oscillospiraceae bacterium]|nr:flagellar filament capping protein FliD [Oscillospiraceae bacterium]MCL2278278.1 flagellar filament capping protein FliD [Oscillospiraceae bacterium]
MINPMNRHSPIRMMGLASGMDTDMIIQQTLRMHQFRIDNRTRDRTILQWRQETHNSIRDEITALQRNFMTASANAMNPLLSRRTFNSTVANINGANSSAVSIRTSTNTPVGSMRIDRIESLAQGARIGSGNSVTGVGGAGLNPASGVGALRFPGNDNRINFTTSVQTTQTVQIPRQARDEDGNLMFNPDDTPVMEYEDVPVTANISQSEWERAMAALNDPDNAAGGSWSDATGSFALPGQDAGAAGNPQVTRQDDGTISIQFGDGVVLAVVPAADDSGDRNITLNGTQIGMIPREVTSGTASFARFEADGMTFDLNRNANGTLSLVEVIPEAEEGDDPHPRANNPFNQNLNSLVLTQTATIQVRTLDENNEYATDGAGNFIYADIEVSRQANIAGGVGAATNGGDLPRFTTEFTVSNNGRSQTFTVDSRESMTSLMERVNRSNLGVTMTYNRLTDRFTIESNTVGSTFGDSVQQTDDDGNLMYDAGGDPIMISTGLSVSDGAGGNMLSLFGLTGAAAETTEGSMAVAYINGERVERNTNTFQFRGLDITLNHTTVGEYTQDEAGNLIPPPAPEPINVSFQRNTDEAFNAIRAFIDAYNTLVSRLETLTSERQSRAQRSYRPLTDEEKQGMTERQVDEWQRVARIGIMRNDNSLERLAFGIRREFFNNIEGMQIDGRPVSASQIGLSTGTHRDGTGGQVMIDEERLRAALERDPEMVADIFARIDVNPETGRNEGVGLIHRLNERFNDFTRMQTDSLTSLENSLRRTNEQIERMQVRMFAEEDRLFRQFAAMEGAMSNMQNQGAWFTSMLGSM